jgi:hypothetical protein
MTDTIANIITSSLDVFQDSPEASDSLLVEKLMSRNIPLEDAWKVVHFTPLAFSRILMLSTGVTFSDKYIIKDREGKSFTKLFSDEPFFEESLKIAVLQSHYCEDYLINIVSRSPELQAINQALHAGSNIEDLVVGSPILSLS